MTADESDDDQTRSYTALTPGASVSHYEILDKIGAGGMGEVYLALDTQLNRKVALKFLPSHLCQDEDCRKRFTREAQAAAGLDHPNIAAIYEVGEYQGRPYFAMQVVEGQSLREVLAGKDLPIERVLEIAIQICEGLQAAHDKGIIHRDIKPSNMLLDSHGRVRIVDFGLASVRGSEQLTKTGSTLGTIGYMSPEQVRGQEVDHRSDLFSLGVVLYELLTKQNPFKRDSEAATLKAVSDDLPHPAARFRAELPDSLQLILDKALDKDTKTRYQHADDLAADLVRLKRVSDSGEHTAKLPIRAQSRRLALSALVIAAIVAAAVFTFQLLESDRSRRAPQYTQRQITYFGDVQKCEISPDGAFYAVSRQLGGKQCLYFADLHGGDPVRLVECDYLIGFRWSPDGTTIAATYFTDSARGSFILPRLGGGARCFLGGTCSSFALGWSPNGKQIALHNSCRKSDSIVIYDLQTQKHSSVPVEIEREWVDNLDWSPGNDFILLTSNRSTTNALWTVPVAGGKAVKVCEGDFSTARWAASSNAVYYAQDNEVGGKALIKAEIDARTGRLAGEPKVLMPDLAATNFSISSDNKSLLCSRRTASSNLFRIAVDQHNPGIPLQLTSGTAEVYQPAVSTDGKWVAYTLCKDGRMDIYRVSVDGGKPERLTFDGTSNNSPAWSPDGQFLAYLHSEDGNAYCLRTLDLSLRNTRTYASSRASLSSSGLHWGGNGEIFYQKPRNRNIIRVDTETGVEQELLLDESHGWIFSARVSPDSSAVAVVWNRWPDTEDGIWTVSLDGNRQQQIVADSPAWDVLLRWSGDGQLLYYCQYSVETSNLCRVNVRTRQVDTLMALPFNGERETDVGTDLTPDLKYVVYGSGSVASDVWLLQDFDPEVN